MIAEQVSELETKVAGLDKVLGEVLATLALPRNQSHTIAEMEGLVARWQTYHNFLMNPPKPEGAD